jgi:hypothetical protein
MTQAQITTMLAAQGLTCTFITQDAYTAGLIASAPIPPTPAQLLAASQAQAGLALQSGTDSVSVLQQAILIVLLNQINSIRALLPTPLGPITQAQAVSAVVSQINSGQLP